MTQEVMTIAVTGYAAETPAGKQIGAIRASPSKNSVESSKFVKHF
jgi:hypothetical protein